MRCAACSTEVPEAARFCDACGAAVYQQAPSGPLKPLPDTEGAARAPRRRLWLWLGVPLAGVAVAGTAASLMATAPPSVNAGLLEDALRTTVAQGDGPGRDPICVANGLAYDGQPVNVQLGNAGTLAWMDALVAAGLYGAGEEAQSGGFLSQPIRTYPPQPALADWSGARRLCMAKAVKLEAVRQVGTVQSMRFRGQSYPGVAAEVVWTLDEPAPWLATPEVAAAFSAELPSWRGARWEVTPEGWRLVQRRNFFLSGTQWLTSESLERVAGVAPRSTFPP
ncbi:MAG: zinc ribbon domain-containing protein [Pseudomonadota bacterium]|nr:zinc ribbon domain-containing protein [Pseudomonadota bacterium]MDQ8019674.1 zinc ribbon domain-containing protein [Pseudomonadota bacterium]